MFQKLLRDLKPLALDGAAAAAAGLALVDGTSSSRPLHNEPLPREVFRTLPGREADEPPLSFDRRLSGAEPWRADTVRDALAHAAAAPGLRELTALFDRLERDRSELTEAKRLVRLFAASACAGTWFHHRDADDFLGDSTWLRGAVETLLEPGGLGDVPISPTWRRRCLRGATPAMRGRAQLGARVPAARLLSIAVPFANLTQRRVARGRRTRTDRGTGPSDACPTKSWVPPRAPQLPPRPVPAVGGPPARRTRCSRRGAENLGLRRSPRSPPYARGR